MQMSALKLPDLVGDKNENREYLGENPGTQKSILRKGETDGKSNTTERQNHKSVYHDVSEDHSPRHSVNQEDRISTTTDPSFTGINSVHNKLLNKSGPEINSS